MRCRWAALENKALSAGSRSIGINRASSAVQYRETTTRRALEHPRVTHTGPHALFLLGTDYHLGDLLWLTPVLAEYRRRRRPKTLSVGLPDSPMSRVLEYNPAIDRLLYGDAAGIRRALRAEAANGLTVHDLRLMPVAFQMLRDWRKYPPWLYYRDLWFRPRGQWLARYLGLGTLRTFRPVLSLLDSDREGRAVPEGRYVVLAPHIGIYSTPFASQMWRRIKGWDNRKWQCLAERLQSNGYRTLTLAAAGQESIPGTEPILGLPIRQAAVLIERSTALITGESGLWFIAAALAVPFVIVPWWLPASVDWASPMNVPHRLVLRGDDSVQKVYEAFQGLIGSDV